MKNVRKDFSLKELRGGWDQGGYQKYFERKDCKNLTNYWTIRNMVLTCERADLDFIVGLPVSQVDNKI